MPTLTAEQRAQFDITQFPSVGFVYLSQPELVFEAPLVGGFFHAGAIVALSYGTPTIGSFSAIEPEMTLELWDDSHNKYGSQRIRQAATASAIFVGRAAQGNKIGELQIADGAVIRVYKERRAFSKIPFIAPNGTQYKDETAYSTDNAAQPPVANAGEDVLIIVPDGTTTATIPLNALGSVPSFAVRQGASVSGYLWALDDGSVVTGTLTSSSLTASFPLGERYVSLRVQDSNGIQHTAYKFVVIATKAMCTPVRIAEEVLRPSGVTWRFTVNLDELPAGIREGTKVLYTQHDDYSLAPVAVRFSGWLGPENFNLKSAEKQQKEITINCFDVAERLRQIHGFPLTVEIAGGTSGWYRMPNANIDRLTHHYLQWHTNLLTLADFSWSAQGATYPLPRFTTDGASIWEQGDRLARAIGYTLTCNTKGQIRVKGDPLVLPTAAQASEFTLPTQRTSTEVTTLTADDYGEHEFDAALPPGTHWLRGSAIVAATTAANITAVKAAAPSKTPGQGRGTQEETEQLVTGQLEFNCRLANRYAARVNPRMGSLTLNMVKSRHIVEPADMEWIRVILPADERAKYPDLSEAGERYLVAEIVNRYNLEQLRKNSTWVLEREFEGVVNSDMTVIDPPAPQQPNNPNNTYSDWSDNYVPVEPSVTLIQTIYGLPPLAENGQGMIAILSNGRIAVTNNFDNPSYLGGPDWTVYDHSATLGTAVLQFCRIAGAADVTGWIITSTKIFKVANAQSATPTFTTQLTFGYTSLYRNIDADALFSPGLFAVVASVDGSAVMETRTIDGGITWGSETEFGSTGSVIEFDFISSDEDFDTYDASTSTSGDQFIGTYSASVGWEDTLEDDLDGPDRSVRGIFIEYIFAGEIEVAGTHELDFSATQGTGDLTEYGARIRLYRGGVVVADTGGVNNSNFGSNQTLQLNHSGTIDRIELISLCGNMTGDSNDPGGSAVFTAFRLDPADITAVPGIHVSTYAAGLVHAGLGIPAGDTDTPVYVAEDYSFAYAQDIDLLDESGMLAGITTKVGSDDTFYYGYLSDGESSIDPDYDDSNNLFRGTLAAGETDITPVVDSERYGPDWLRSRYTIAVSDTDGNIVAFVGTNLMRSKFGVFITGSALAFAVEWVQLVEPDAGVDYRRVMLGANASSLIVFGANGAIAYSDNPLNPAALDNRTGDLSTSTEIIGIASF